MFRNRVANRAAPWPLIAPLAILLAGQLCAQTKTPSAPADEIATPNVSRVLGISDKCAVEVTGPRGKRTIVLAGVLVPEDSEACAQLKGFLTRLLSAEDVAVHEIPHKDDKAPRQAYLFRMPERLFVNVEVVRLGYAKAILDHESEHYDVFRKYQRRAKKAEKGVWSPRRSPPTRTALAKATHSGGDQADIIVYVTKSGKKYHRKSCYHLRKSSRAITLAEALAKGYTPCKSCKPPTTENP